MASSALRRKSVVDKSESSVSGSNPRDDTASFVQSDAFEGSGRSRRVRFAQGSQSSNDMASFSRLPIDPPETVQTLATSSTEPVASSLDSSHVVLVSSRKLSVHTPTAAARENSDETWVPVAVPATSSSAAKDFVINTPTGDVAASLMPRSVSDASAKNAPTKTSLHVVVPVRDDLEESSAEEQRVKDEAADAAAEASPAQPEEEEALFTAYAPIPATYIACDEDAIFASKGIQQLAKLVEEAAAILIQRRLMSEENPPEDFRLTALLHLINTTLECAKNSHGRWVPPAAGFETAIDTFQQEWEAATVGKYGVARDDVDYRILVEDAKRLSAAGANRAITSGGIIIPNVGKVTLSVLELIQVMCLAIIFISVRQTVERGSIGGYVVYTTCAISLVAGALAFITQLRVSALNQFCEKVSRDGTRIVGHLVLRMGAGRAGGGGMVDQHRGGSGGLMGANGSGSVGIGGPSGNRPREASDFFLRESDAMFSVFSPTPFANPLLTAASQQPQNTMLQSQFRATGNRFDSDAPVTADSQYSAGRAGGGGSKGFGNPIGSGSGGGFANAAASSSGEYFPISGVPHGGRDAGSSSMSMYAPPSFSRPAVIEVAEPPALPQNFDSSKSVLSLCINERVAAPAVPFSAAGSIIFNNVNPPGSPSLGALQPPTTPPPVTRAVQLDVRSVTDRVLLIVTDLDGKVVFWDEGAIHMLGFLTEDAMGKNINNFIYSESSCELYERMVRAASTKVPMTAKQLTLVHRSYGSVVVRASVASVHSGGSTTVGFSLCASEVESGAQRTQSLLHQFVLDDMANEVAVLEAQFKHAMTRFTLSRIGRLLEKLAWSSMVSISTTVSDWQPTTLSSVLENSLRNRHQFIDVSIDPSVPTVLVCDVYTVAPALSELMAAVAGKSQLKITSGKMRGCFSQIVIDITVKMGFKGDMSTKISYASDTLLPVCGEAVQTSNDSLRFTFPFLADESTINQAGRSAGAASSSTRSTGGEDGSPAITINVILVEKSPVFRQNIIQSVCSMGHSLRVSDTYEKCAVLIDTYAREVGALLVYVDDGIDEAEALLELVRQHPHIMIILTSESPLTNLPKDVSFLAKPIQRLAMEKQLDAAAAREAGRRADDERNKKNQEMLRTVRHSPWERGKKLGKGAFADVYEAQMTMTGGKMAVKMLRVRDWGDETIQQLLNEIEILYRLDHPNIIHYFYCEQGEKTINLFMQLAESGSLVEYLARQPSGKLTETELARVTKQLLHALDYLHQQGIVHRDIKPGNILLTQGNFLLTDFGTATFDQVSKDTQGTVYFMAPEVLDGAGYGKACDIWSLGCVLCECLKISRSPVPGGGLGHAAPTPVQLQPLSNELRSFLALCFKMVPNERPTAGSLIYHAFVADREMPSVMTGDVVFRRRSFGGAGSMPKTNMFVIDTGDAQPNELSTEDSIWRGAGDESSAGTAAEYDDEEGDVNEDDDGDADAPAVPPAEAGLWIAEVDPDVKEDSCASWDVDSNE